MRILSLEATLKLIELAGKSYRPPEIVALKEKIDAKTTSLEIKTYAGGITYEICQKEIQEIVDMKLQLDILYAEWVEREVGSDTITEGG